MCTWTGLGADALWSTAANWSGGAVPTSAETAFFTGDGNGKTAIGLGSSATAAGITFAPDAAAYTIGLPEETLTLAANGTLTLPAGAANDQTVNASLCVNGNFYVYNYEPTKTLTLSYTNTVSRSIYLRGSGPVTFNTLRRAPAQEETDTNYTMLESRINAPLTFTERTTIGALWSYDFPLNLTFAPHTTNIFCRNDWNFAIYVGGSMNGEGAALRIIPSDPTKRARIAIESRRLDMNVQLIAPNGFETTGGWRRGTLVLNHPDNDIRGTLAFDRGNGVEVAFLAPNGTPNPLGSCTTVNFVNPLDSGIYSRLRVTGATASSADKIFTVDKDRAVIENAGSGTLTLTGDMTGAGTFVFDASGPIVLSGVRSGTGGLIKAGAGTLTLTAANTYSGATSIESGTLALPAGASLGSGTFTLAGGTLALNPAAADNYAVTLPAITLTEASQITVPAAATASSVTFAAITLNGNVLTINAPSVGTAANRIFISGLAAGPVDGIVINGGPAAYSTADGLMPQVLPAAAIVNDTLPDAAGHAATADTAPAGDFTIAAPLTTLGQFSYTAAAPATLDLGGGILALNYFQSEAPLSVVNGTLTASGASSAITYPGLRTVNIVPLTSDAATGLSTSKTYSHLIDFGNQSPATINGVTFTKGAANGTGTDYSGFPNGNGFANWNEWTNALPPETCSGLLSLLYDMNYNSNWTGQLTGLTPGAIYEVTLYFRAWDPPSSTQERRCLYQFYSTASAFPDTSVIYASQPNSANAIVYRYMAPANGTLKIAEALAKPPHRNA
jgi:autotransporter-associated beta strand protein